MNADDQQKSAPKDDEVSPDPDAVGEVGVGEVAVNPTETRDADAGTTDPEAKREESTSEEVGSAAGPVPSQEESPPKRAKTKRSKPAPPVEEAEGDEPKMDWYILKVQSNRENSICDGLRRRVAIEDLDEFFGDILVPTEDVAEFKNGKRKVSKRKLYPGYIVVNMVINDETWFAVRETPGIGDFTGAAGKPTPMLSHEVDRILKAVRPDEEDTEAIKTAIPFNVGDRIRIKEGTFENFEGDVDIIDEANGRVTIMINIFGRSTPVELEHWQIEAI